MKENVTFRQKVRRSLRLDRAVRLVWKSAPGWTLVNTGLTSAQGLLPLLSLYLMKRIVDEVTVGLASADRIAAFQRAGVWIVLAVGAALLTALLRSFSELTSQAQSLVVTDAIFDILHTQSVSVDLEYYEDPRYFDTLHRAQHQAPYRPMQIVNGLIQLVQSGLSLAGVGVLLFTSNATIGAVLLAAAVPGALVRLWYARQQFDLQQRRTEAERRVWYYNWMMTSGVHAKEIRLFNLGGLFKERFQTLQRTLREEKLALARRRSLIDLIAQTVVTGATFGSFAFVCFQAIGGVITLGSLVMYYQGFQLGISSFQSFLRGLAGLYEDNLFLTNFYQFLELTPKVSPPAEPRQVPEPMRTGITFESVCFTYPSQTQQVLTGIDLHLAPGHVIAFVGENGAGKTTLIKLLCRLYDPGAGRICVDGIDLRDFDPTDWRRQISVVFQDYVHYFMPAWENIWLGNVDKEPDREAKAIAEAARISGADALIRRLPHGYNTMLGTEFEQGHELSIGEWQKVALARAFFRDSRIIVLDEPTSSLDPLAEADLFRKFRQLIQGRSAILISHRFSTVRYADTIYVVKDGRISEHGPHEALLSRGGDYSRLYLAQAQHYT